MPQPDWQSAEDTLFTRSREIISQFVRDHPDEVFALFAYSVDCDYTGVALNFDTLENSILQTQREVRSRIAQRNQLFALDHGWKNARYYVASATTRTVDWNMRGEWKYDLIAFVELPVWEEYFNNSEKAPQLEGRIIVAMWRVVERLVADQVFDGLQMSSPFRIAFSFHDDETIVLRLLNWPG
jgi:hypothetical protein